MVPEDPALQETPKPRAGVAVRAKQAFSNFYENIWTPPEVAPHHLPMRVFARIWRVIEITVSNTISNNITIHAAALTYYALMALAPFVMLVLTIFGIVMNVKGDEAVELVQSRMAETMQIILPDGVPDDATTTTTSPLPLERGGAVGRDADLSDEELVSNKSGAETAEPAGEGANEDALTMVAPQLQEFSGMLLKNTMANSGSSGTIGTLILAVLAIFMIAHVEDAYNRIWTVKKARSWPRRFLVYFIFIVVGGVLAAMTTSILSVSTILKRISESTSEVSDFVANIPGGVVAFDLLTSFVPALLAFAIFTLLFGCVNRYLPYANVRWVPALIGGAFVGLAFIFCVKAGSLFVKKISDFNSIYGNLGVIFILMFGLYLAWMFLLLGGQISYAVQNERFFKNTSVRWQELSMKSRQEACFACLFSIFDACANSKKGMTLDELAGELRLPANMISECVSTLSELSLILERYPEAGDSGAKRYSVELPVGKMTISEIRMKFDNFSSGEQGISARTHHHHATPQTVSLGGSSKTRAALAEFSDTFDLGNDSKTLESLLS